MGKKSRRSPTFRRKGPVLSPAEPACRRVRTRGSDRRAGQAYTEYLIILLFGVLVCLGLVAFDQQQNTGIMDRLYGYMFDYYAGIANFVNLPIF